MRIVLFRLIGVLEIAGGFYGLALMLHRLLPFGPHESVVALIGAALYGFVLAAGIQLVAGSEHGVRMSRWVQLLQLPLIALPVFSYALHCGAFVNVFATLQASPRLDIDWHVGSQGFVLAMAGPAVSHIGINLLALLSWLLLRLR